MNPEPILVVCTTNRPHSLTATVAGYYYELLQGKKVPVARLSLMDLPDDFTMSALYANKRKNADFNLLIAKMDLYKKYVFIVPQYNGSFPGVFKAFIDGYAEANIFVGKKCALVGVSKGRQGGVMGLSHLTDILHYLGMVVHPMQPKLCNMPDTNLATLEGKSKYLSLLEQQANLFIHF